MWRVRIQWRRFVIAVHGLPLREMVLVGPLLFVAVAMLVIGVLVLA